MKFKPLLLPADLDKIKKHSVKIRERNDPKKLRTEMDTLQIGKKLFLRPKNFYPQTTEKMKV